MWGTGHHLPKSNESASLAGRYELLSAEGMSWYCIWHRDCINTPMFVSRVCNLEDMRLLNAFGMATLGTFIDINPVDEALSASMTGAGWAGQIVNIDGVFSVQNASDSLHDRDGPASVIWPTRVDWLRLCVSGWTDGEVLGWLGHLPDTLVLLARFGGRKPPLEILSAIADVGMVPVLFDGTTHFFAKADRPDIADNLCRPLNEDRCAIFAYRLPSLNVRQIPEQEVESGTVAQMQRRLAIAQADIERLEREIGRQRWTLQRLFRALKRRLPGASPRRVTRNTGPDRAALIEALDLSREDAIEAWAALLSGPGRN